MPVSAGFLALMTSLEIIDYLTPEKNTLRYVMLTIENTTSVALAILFFTIGVYWIFRK